MFESRTELEFQGFNPTKRNGHDNNRCPINLNYPNYRSVDDDDQDFLFGLKIVDDDDPTGVCTPPLWKTGSPVEADENPVQPLSNRSNLRSQAIARGQWELMEMVRNMPESCYELSLKDLVENSRVLEQECLVSDPRKKMKKKKNVKLVRIGSIDNCKSGGLFLKLVFPFSLGGLKKKKKEGNWERSSKGQGQGQGRVEKEWGWMNGFWVFSSSARRTDDKTRNRGNNRKSESCLIPGCWSFLFTNKGKQK